MLWIGANPNAKLDFDWTALHISAYNGYSQVCEVLIREGVDVTATTELGQTPLHLAVSKDSIEAVTAILVVTEKMSSERLRKMLDAGDAEGMTALHFAIKERNEAMAELLLSFGANPTLSNLVGESVFSFAADSSQYELLREYTERRWGGLIADPFPTKSHSSPVIPDFYMENCLLNEGNSSHKTDISGDLFRLIGFLGKGAFGEVYLVEHKPSKGRFALKSIEKGRDITQYMHTERNVLIRLNHPFIVRLHWAFQSSTHLFLVGDYCAGGDLSELLTREKALPEHVVRFYAAEVVLAIEAIHSENVLYRDLKPENIVIDEEGHIKLTDFGLAKDAMPAWAMTRTFCGPPGYFPPEMTLQQAHGQAVDWYMLGCLMYEMLTGIPPYRAREATKLYHKIQEGRLKFPPKMSEEAKDLIQRLLHIDSQERLGRNGATEVKTHPFFEEVDWTRVLAKDVWVPFQPRPKEPGTLKPHTLLTIESHHPTNHIEGWDFSLCA